MSPDGSQIVFDHLGDLYLLPIAGGAATRLAEGLSFDAQPRFSPDGSRVVYISDRSGAENVWVISTDGVDTLQITKGNQNEYASPEWTPDGDYIVASKIDGLFGTAKLWLYHVDGGTGTALIKEPDDLKTMGASFGPDQRYIWFAERTGNWQYNAIFPQYQLAVYDRETGRRTTMSARYGSAFRPAISPDGRWLVYGSRLDVHTGLRIRDTESGEERWLAYPVQRDDQESTASLDVLPGYAFTPDSRAVVVSYGGRIWRVPVDGTEAAEIPFRIDVELPLGPAVRFEYRIEDSPTFTLQQIRDAVPSPSGDRLAFIALDHLWVMDYPDGEPVRLTDLEVGEFHPAWSPDGSLDRLRYLVRRGGRPHLPHARRRRRDGRTADPRLRLLPAARLGSGWVEDRGGQKRGQGHAGGERLLPQRPGRGVRLDTGDGRGPDVGRARRQPIGSPLLGLQRPDLRLQPLRRARLLPLGRHR